MAADACAEDAQVAFLVADEAVQAKSAHAVFGSLQIDGAAPRRDLRSTEVNDVWGPTSSVSVLPGWAASTRFPTETIGAGVRACAGVGVGGGAGASSAARNTNAITEETTDMMGPIWDRHRDRQSARGARSSTGDGGTARKPDRELVTAAEERPARL